MPYASSLLLLAGIYLAVLASPGPNFFILSQMALDGRRAEARWVVLGLTTGSICWVVLSLAGLSALLASHPSAATAVRLLGAAYRFGTARGCWCRPLHPAVRPARRRGRCPVRHPVGWPTALAC